ncbi:MAG TPA: TonB-dependent receptor [Bryobacteraceae bacterium]|nr:TonB-dependent receptor [Bryobacteraceae bacterium]
MNIERRLAPGLPLVLEVFMSRRRWFVSAIAGVTALLLIAPLDAQLSTAAVNGSVRDSTGGNVPSATILLTNTETGVQRTTMSNNAGKYLFLSLAPGHYTLEAGHPGFQTLHIEPFVLEVNQTATFDLTLEVGQVQQSVDVTATGEAIEASTSELGAVVAQKQVVDLPLNGRNFTQLLTLSPGASPANVSQNSGGGFASYAVGVVTYPAFNGQSNRSNVFLLDGVFDTSPDTSVYAVPPIVDAIQEFKVQTHNDQAEFGLVTGGVINVVTKSGANAFHGSGWEFLRNDAFDARNFFRPSVTPLRQDMFGATLGGPIIHNRTFFFVAYQGYIQHTPANTLYRVPTAANLNGDFSDWPEQIYDPLSATVTPSGQVVRSPFPGNQIPVSRFNSGYVNFLRDTVPGPVFTGVANFNQIDLTPSGTTQHEYSGRIDHTFGAKDFAWARVSGQNYDLEGSGGRQGLTSSTVYTPINIAASWVHTFGPSSVLQVQFGRAFDQKQSGTRFAAGTNKVNQDTGFATDFCCSYRSGAQYVPSIIVNQYFSGGENAETATYGDVWQYKANYSVVHGNHEFKFGGEWDEMGFQDILNDLTVTFDAVGTADPQNQGKTGDPLASYLLDVPLAGERRDFFKTTRPGGIMGFYGQDSWKATRRLTVNFGLRYDATFIPPLGNTAKRSIYMGDLDLLNGTYILQANPGSCATVGAPPCIPTPDGSLPAHVVLSPNQKILHNWMDNWQPRLGLAYRLSDKMVLRAGFGIFFDSFSGIIQMDQNLGETWPSIGRQLTSNFNQPTAAQPLPAISGKDPFPNVTQPAANPFSSGAFFTDPNFKDARSMQWNFGLQHQFNANTLLEADYVGSGNRRLDIGGYYNVALTPGPGSPSARSPFPYIAPTNFDRSWGRSDYEALQVQLRRRYSNGFSFTAAYTWSKSISIGCDGFFGVEGCSVQDPYHFNNDRSVSSTNIPQDLSLNWLYELPIGAGKWVHTGNHVADYLIGDWQVNGIASIYSGLPVNFTVNGDIANTGNASGYMRPNLVGNPSISNQTVTEWFNTAAFAVPAAYTFGNVGRNILRGPAIVDFDFSLFRRFPIRLREGMAVELRAEAYNVFNTTHFGAPVANLSNVNFGQITSASGSRQLQLGARIDF